MPRVVIVGIDRGHQRMFRTRRNLARLIGIPYDGDFYRRFAWTNLYGDDRCLTELRRRTDAAPKCSDPSFSASRA